MLGTCPVGGRPAPPHRARPAGRCSLGSVPGWIGTPGRCCGPPELAGAGETGEGQGHCPGPGPTSLPQLTLPLTCWVSLAGICWKRSQAFQKVTFSALNSFFRNSWSRLEKGKAVKSHRDCSQGMWSRDWDRAKKPSQTDSARETERGRSRGTERKWEAKRSKISCWEKRKRVQRKAVEKAADRGVPLASLKFYPCPHPHLSSTLPISPQGLQ